MMVRACDTVITIFFTTKLIGNVTDKSVDTGAMYSKQLRISPSAYIA